MSGLITIFGGSGFVGRYITWRMVKQGWRVRVAVRNPNEALFVKSYGDVGQVEPVFTNIRDSFAVKSVVQGTDAIVNCVGTFDRLGKNNFEAIQSEAPKRIAEIASEMGITRFVHISSIGADALSESAYSRTKGEGERFVLEGLPTATVLRPSVIFGTEDNFFNRFAQMAKISPFIPLAGAKTKFQPVFVDDVAAAAEKAVIGNVKSGTYELGGPDIKTFEELIKDMLKIIKRQRIIIKLPFMAAGFLALGFDFAETVTNRLLKNKIITQDQLKSLRQDNVVTGKEMTFADLGINPVCYQAILPDYLWCYRPAGQYSAIKDSAKGFKRGGN